MSLVDDIVIFTYRKSSRLIVDNVAGIDYNYYTNKQKTKEKMMNQNLSRESIKAVGVLLAAFLSSMVLASFFYIQPGGAQASVNEEIKCRSHATIKDSETAANTIVITVESNVGCPANPMMIIELSQEGYETPIVTAYPSISADGTRTVSADILVDPNARGYFIRIDGAFSASLAP